MRGVERVFFAVALSALILGLGSGCKINEGLHVLVMRHAENQGFHRTLLTTVEITLTRATLPPACKILLKETFPSSLYVDGDQLQHLGYFHVHVPDKVDVEKTAYSAPELTFLVFSPMNVTGNLITTSIGLPIHLRYQRPLPHNNMNVGYTTVFLQPPKVFLRCQGDTFQRECPNQTEQAPCDAEDARHTCNWLSLPYRSTVSVLRMQVPMGNTNHAILVVVITGLVTFGGCFYIIFTLNARKICNV